MLIERFGLLLLLLLLIIMLMLLLFDGIFFFSLYDILRSNDNNYFDFLFDNIEKLFLFCGLFIFERGD
jgi:hypothetical protein